MKYTTVLTGLILAVQGAMAQQDSIKETKKIEKKHLKIVITDDPEEVREVDSMSDELEMKRIIIRKHGNKIDTLTENIEKEIVIHQNDAWKHGRKGPKKPKLVETKGMIMELGLNNYLHDGSLEPSSPYKAMEADKARSINFNLGIVQQGLNLVKGKLRLVYGVGIEFNNYRFIDDIDLNADSRPLEIKENTEINYKKNKLVTQYLTAPLMLNYKSNPNHSDESFNFSAGVVAGYLIGSHQKQKWEANGTEKRKIRDDFNLSDFRYGYAVSFGYGDFNLYAKYYPSPVFKDNRGPALNTVAAGIVINAF
jgi:uncharacterized protein involved in tellurium resistance